MVATFKKLLDTFPQSPLRAMAAFSVGDSLFKNLNYAGAEPLLLNARDWDANAWLQPATQRLVLGAYGMKDYDKTVSYLKEYETIPAPTDPQAQIAARLPAALFYWLGETAAKAGKWNEAETYYARVDAASRSGRSAGRRVVATRRSAKPSRGMARRRRQLPKISRPETRGEGRDRGAARAGPRATWRAEF